MIQTLLPHRYEAIRFYYYGIILQLATILLVTRQSLGTRTGVLMRLE